MKLLVPFFVFCAMLVSWFAWELVSRTDEHPQTETLPSQAASNHASAPTRGESATATVPSRPPDRVTGSYLKRDDASEPEDSENNPKPGVAPPEPVPPPTPTGGSVPLDPAREPTTRTAVRWADDENNSAELRKLRAARAALADDPYRRVALHDEFEALRELGRWDEARITLARLIEFDPQDTDLRFAQACVLLRLSRWLHAIDALQAVVRAQPEHARAWYNLATAHQRLGRLREARHAWDRVVTLTPEAPDAFAHRGEILLDLREWAAAAEDFRAALQRDPEAADVAINLARACRKLNRLGEAHASLLAVVTRNPRHVPALNSLAELAWEAYSAATEANEQHRRDAISWWRRSLAVDPQQPTIETLLANAQKH